MASRLTTAARQRAVDFIEANGTNLLRELYAFHFTGGSKSNVVAALGHYQNADGGFGHGLEADLRTRNSSVIATTVGLQILSETGAWDAPLVAPALRFLSERYSDRNWQLITEDCNDAPFAPWWKYASPADTSAFTPNPSVEVLSYLITWCAMGKSTRFALLDRAIDHIASNELEMHDLLCYLRLYDNPKLPENYRRELLPHLLSQAFALVKVERHDWEEYGLTPLSVVFSPDSPLADFFGPAIDENLDYLIERQGADGSWSPTWSWGNTFPEAWKEAEREIKVQLTLRHLQQLQQFGRLD